MSELQCPFCHEILSEDMVEAQMCFNCGETFDEISMTQEELDKYARKVEEERGENPPDIFEQFREKRDEELNNLRRIVAENTARKKEIEARYEKMIVTTGDLKHDYEVIAPVYFQLSNKGLFSSTFSKLAKAHAKKLNKLTVEGQMSLYKADWGFLYDEWSVGQNVFDKAFFIAVEELKKRAAILGADAIVSMRHDIDLDTNGLAYFYLQMYGTAVKYTENNSVY